MGETEGKAAAGRDWAESIIIAIGGNLALGGSTVEATLEAGLRALGDAGVEVVAQSRFWSSAAWPDPREPAYLNAVARVRTALAPEALLAALHAVEATFGRVRSRANAARPLDLDLIAYGRLVREVAPILPHSRAAERRFVMGPLAEIAPHWRHPVTGETAAELAAQATVGLDAAPAP